MKNLEERKVVTLKKEDVKKLGLDNYYIQMLYDRNLSKRLELFITYIGVSKYKGVPYLKTAINFMLNDFIAGRDISVTCIYKNTANKHKIKYGATERNIRSIKEKFWYKDDEITMNIKKFLFGNIISNNESITNTDFLFAIVQFLLTEFELVEYGNEEEKEYKKLVLENYGNPANILSNFAKDTNSFPISKEEKEKLGCFYWILGKLAENLGDYVYKKNPCDKSFYYLKFVVTYIDNGKVVIIPKSNSDSTYCVSNKDVLLNVIHSIDNLENYRAHELIDTISEFTVWLEKE